jgi:hypothetical protein
MFDPNLPAENSEMRSAEMRNQFNDLNDRLVAAFAALDWSNGAPKLPDVLTITAPVNGNVAFDYEALRLAIYAGNQWILI